MRILFGGQFGSEGKGLLASYVASKPDTYDVAITDAGPNSGHTAVLEDDTKVVTYHLPMAGVLNKNSVIYLNGGAIIDIAVLTKEIMDMDRLGFDVSSRLYIHPKAAIIRGVDKAKEKAYNSEAHKISSTQKGVGQAVASKILRDGLTFDIAGSGGLGKFMGTPHFDKSRAVIEVSQGYSLGCNTEFYPYTTSRVCTPAQGLMNAGLPTTVPHTVMVAMRMWPIRVGSLPGTTSGSVYPDQEEVTWEELGLEPQITTVTGRVRRVFTFSAIQTRAMMWACEPNTVLLNFCNHATPRLVKKVDDVIKEAHTMTAKPLTMLYGYGPKASDIYGEIQG